MKIIIIFLLLFLPSVTFCELPQKTTEELNSQLEKFKTLMEFSFVYHKDSINISEKAEEALKAYMQSLDSKSYYFPEDQYKALKEANTGIKKSFGFSQLVFADTSYIFRIEPHSSADSNKISPGWRLISINDKKVTGIPEAEINELINDTIQEINTTFKDLKGNPHTFKIYNSKHITSSIDASFMLNDTIGYIKSLKFTEKAGDEFENTISNLPFSMKGLIIDLRDNPGGVLTAIQDVISLFIEKDKQVVRTISKHPDYEYNVKSKSNGKFIGLPLVLIVNDETASAAELFAGAVQDYDLGIVVGKRTYGKGTLQKHWEFKDGSAFRITVGEYVTPMGRKVQKETKKAFDSSFETMDENLDKQLKSLSIPKEVKTFKSSKGRSLISIGGILPDSSYNKIDSTTKLTSVAKNKRVFIRTAYEIFLAERENVLKTHSDYLSFSKEFIFNEVIYDKIKNNLLKSQLQNDEMYEQDKHEMSNIVKHRLAQLLFGDKGYYCSSIFDDDEVLYSINIMKDAQILVRNE